MHTKTRRAPLARATIALLFSSLCLPALASTGTALGVRQDAELVDKATTRVLTVGADVFIGDQVVTGPSGQVQIKFSDATELVVGPNSALTIEDYLLRNDNSPGQFAIKALAGTFRFATGHAAKDRYLIETPTGTIGVRGTAFDFNVAPDATRVLLFHGAVKLCNLEKECTNLTDTCELGAYDASQVASLGIADDLRGDIRRQFKTSFRYAETQSPLLREFWVPNARQCFNTGFAGVDAPKSLMVGDKPAPTAARPPAPDGCSYDDNGELFCN